MPTVPRLESQQVAPAPTPGVRSSVDASLESFGGGASLAKVGEATNKLADTGFKIAEEEKKKADEAWSLGAKNDIMALHGTLQNGPNGFRTRHGLGINGLPDQVATDWQRGIQSIKENANNDYQREQVDKLASNQWGEVNQKLQEHIFNERVAIDNDNLKTNLALIDQDIPNYVNPDGSVNKDKMDEAIQGKRDAIEKFGYRQEVSPEHTKMTTDNEISSAHSQIVRTLIAKGRGTEAQKYFDENAGEIVGSDKPVLISAMEREVALDRGVSVFAYGKKNFLRPDGTVDDKKLENYAMTTKDFGDISMKERLELSGIAKARSGEDYQNIRRDDAARERQFSNTVISGRNQSVPVPMEEAMRVADRMGKDSTEQLLFRDTVQKLYSNNKDHDPDTYMRLWTAVQDGHANIAEIRQMQLNGKITVGQREQLEKDDYNYRFGGISELEKQHWVDLHNTITSEYKSDPGKGKQVESLMKSISAEKGLSAEQTIELYGNEKKNNPNSGLRTPAFRFRGLNVPSFPVPFFGGETNLATDLRQSQFNTVEMGKIHNNVGKDQVDLIADGVMRSKPSFNIQDMDAFAAQFDGYKNIAKGTPVNNAILSLQNDRRKPPVNAENIRAVLKAHPDGRY